MVVVMLQDDSLEYYINNLSDLETIEDVFDGLRSWFTSSEQRQRVLVEWQSATFEQFLKAYSQESEARCFQCMCVRLSATQRQLDKAYHADTLLKDRIVQTMSSRRDIMQALRAYPPDTAQVAQQRIASFLSSNSRGITDSSIFQRQNTALIVDRRFDRPLKAAKNFKKHLKGSLRCWICQGAHRARERHTQEEIRASLRTRTNMTEVDVEEEDLIFAFSATGGPIGDDQRNESDEEADGEIDVHLTDSLCSDVNEYITSTLADHAFCHAIRGTSVKQATEQKNAALRYGEDGGFVGLAVDSACVGKSVIGLGQLKAYCKKYGVPMSIDTSQRLKVTYGSGPVRSLGSRTLTIPMPRLGADLHQALALGNKKFNGILEYSIEFLVVSSDIPALLSLDDMDARKRSLHSHERELVLRASDGHILCSPLTRHPQHRLLFHEWSREEVQVLYTIVELRKLHRSLGHRSVEQLAKVLRRARPEEFSSETRHALEEIVSRCQPCQTRASQPRRFKLTAGTDDLRFNHSVLVDIMYLHNMPVLHIVDEATHFMAAGFLSNSISARETWRLLRNIWINTYLGPPNHLKVDAGIQFTSEEFRTACKASDIEVEEIPIESPSSLSTVERYHAPLRISHLKLEQELPLVDPAELLELAVKSVNDSVNPAGLCPTLLVFGDFPKIIRRRDLPPATQIERACAIDKAMDAVQAEYARARVQLGQRHTGQAGGETTVLDNLHPGSPVLVFRAKPHALTGPFPFISKEGETCVLQLPRGRKMFCSTVVKPYKSSLEDDVVISKEASQILFTSANYFGPEDQRTLITKVVGAKNFPGRFEKSRAKEFHDLVARNTFRVFKRSEAAVNRAYGMRYVDALKNFGEEDEYEKSRLVVQAYLDDGDPHSH